MVVAVQQAALVPIASVEDIFKPPVGASLGLQSGLYPQICAHPNPLICILLTRIPPNQSGGGQLSAHN